MSDPAHSPAPAPAAPADPALMMTCDEVEALLPLVADGGIDADSDPVLFEHLHSCEHCQRSLALHDLCELALTPSGPIAPAKPRPAAITHFALPWPLAAAASLLVAVGAAVLLLGGTSSTGSTAVAVTAEQAPAPARVVRSVGEIDGQQVWLIEHDGQQYLVGPDQIDNGRDRDGNGAVPVIFQGAGKRLPQIKR